MQRGQGLVLIAVFAWLALVTWFLSQSPSAPDEASGAIFAVPNHGHTAYVPLWGYVLIAAPPLAGAVIALGGFGKRKR